MANVWQTGRPRTGTRVTGDKPAESLPEGTFRLRFTNRGAGTRPGGIVYVRGRGRGPRAGEWSENRNSLRTLACRHPLGGSEPSASASPARPGAASAPHSLLRLKGESTGTRSGRPHSRAGSAASLPLREPRDSRLCPPRSDPGLSDLLTSPPWPLSVCGLSDCCNGWREPRPMSHLPQSAERVDLSPSRSLCQRWPENTPGPTHFLSGARGDRRRAAADPPPSG